MNIITLESNQATLAKLTHEQKMTLLFENISKPKYWKVREEYLAKENMRKGLVNGVETAMQTVLTPFALCDEMITKLKEYLGPYPKGLKILVYNVEFLDILHQNGMLFNNEVWFVNENPMKVQFAKDIYKGDTDDRFEVKNWMEWDTKNMKFDVIVGNPPYQAPQVIKNDKGISGGGETLWNKFVEKSFELLKKDGHLCFVHPSGWRDVAGKFEDVKDTLLSNTIKYLEMHGATDGQKTFGAATCYDWYVAQKKSNNGELTEIKCGSNASEFVNLNSIPFVPTGMFDVISNLLAKTMDEACEVLHSHSAYETRKPYVSDKKKEGFNYPLIYTITANGEKVNLWYSNTNKNGHFGIPKVIFTNGAGSSAIVDATGEFGLCQFSYAIVDSPENLPLIQKAMVSEKFLNVMKACQMQGFNKYSWKVMKCFRKDFWKSFVDENGKEI